MRVVIVGGGLAGLALAAHLERDGVVHTVVEQAESWERTGFAIGLWSSGLDVLDELGVGDAVRHRGTPLNRFEVRAGGGTLLREVDVPDARFVAIHRADLHAALRTAVPADRVRLGARVTDVAEHDDAVVVHLADQQTLRADVVVGADGVHSRVRRDCFDDWRVGRTGEVAWSFWTPDAAPRSDATVELWSRGREAFITEVGGRGLVNVAAPADQSVPPPAFDHLVATARQLGWMLPQLVAGIDDPDGVFATPTETVHAASWATDRVVLIGDAAHALHPISGMGASVALEDARTLARALLRHRGQRPAAALRSHVTQRRGPVRRAKLTARIEHRATFATSRCYTAVRNALIRHTPLFELFLRHQASR